ncbi:Obg family GTPase CgtA, partial [Candidatus Saccharibacteria bacterium]|nr:Obg family GTPase CgtA [Candidatus Saccharibacteria bacterium]
DLLIADIPGLIEGAAEGKGLGHAFLRHVDRTAVLLHLVDVYNDDAGKAYKTIRDELAKYSDLKDRPEIVALTKCEGLDPEIINLQKQSILAQNPKAKIFAISSSAHQNLEELLRELKNNLKTKKSIVKKETKNSELPTITLNPELIKDTWKIEKIETEEGEKFVVTGEKIEKFARRTDFNNYASVNRLRDILKKMGIRAELTSQGAEPDSIISIADREFTLVEDW